MSITRRSYSRDFKNSAVKKMIEHGLSYAEAGRDLGINDGMLRNWKRKKGIWKSAFVGAIRRSLTRAPTDNGDRDARIQTAFVGIWDAVQTGKNPRAGELIYTIRHQSNGTDVGARKNHWKICRKNGRWQLFNLQGDISESNDLSMKHPDLLIQMMEEDKQLCQQHTRPLWFDSPKQAERWKSNPLPYFEGTFLLNQ